MALPANCGYIRNRLQYRVKRLAQAVCSVELLLYDGGKTGGVLHRKSLIHDAHHPTNQRRHKGGLGWEGVHLFAMPVSLCSRKVGVALALKSVPYTLHTMAKSELRTSYYLGINPRGLVPVLVHDGTVVIESNDILQYLESTFPTPPLLPVDAADAAAVQRLLDLQDAYHLDIRTLTFKHMFESGGLRAMAASTVAQMRREEEGGLVDVAAAGQGRAQQMQWYAAVAQDGITDEQVTRSVGVFREQLGELDAAYSRGAHLVGGALSLADVAIWVDVERLLQVAPAEFRLEEELPHLVGAFRRLEAALGEHFRAFGRARDQ